jgi:hypothetical protein
MGDKAPKESKKSKKATTAKKLRSASYCVLIATLNCMKN